MTISQANEENEGSEGYANNWLPLPETGLQGPGVGQVAGCIRTDEIVIRRQSSDTMPPIWTVQGSAQWVGVLQEAQLYGHMVRLLIHPYVPGVLSKDNATPIAENVLEVYLSRSQWRDVEVASGQQLVLEIPAKAIHVFE